MPKNFAKNAEDQSLFLIHTVTDDDDRNGDRADTSPFKAARMIDIKRIQPDPNQPRKTFNQETLESLAESIRELGEIIDPLTVEYVDQQDFFRIISGERRFRAAKLVGLERLPCILKDVDDKKRILLQLIANLQRENITSLEETVGIRTLIEKFSYTQVQVAKVLNKSKSYVSQILGLERLSPFAKEIVQTSELSKEVQIQASRETAPEKQVEILKKASSEGQTVKQLREDLIEGTSSSDGNVLKKPDTSQKTFKKWTWIPKDKSFVLTVQFKEKQNKAEKVQAIRTAIDKTQKHLVEID